MYIFNPYYKECFLFYNLCNFIYFLKRVREENENNYIMFLSRDAYFLYLLYNNIYPELKIGKDYSYVFSSRICFSERNNDNYKRYIESFKNKKEKILMIDVYGSGTTFLNFIEHYKIEYIQLLFFCHDNTRDTYLKHLWKEYVIGFLKDSKGIILENIFRAPHYKVVGLKEDFTPLQSRNNFFDKTDIINDRNKQHLLNLYQEIISNMSYHENIRFFTLGIHQTLNINDGNKYKSLVALDIDNTITNIRDYKYLQEMIDLALKNNIKIILVTARQKPYKYGDLGKQKFSHIEKILKDMNYNYENNVIDIWYNPYCFIHSNVSSVKYQTIQKNMDIYDIPKNKVLFFDDCLENVKYTGNKGIVSRLVIVNKGFDQECLELFKSKLINIDQKIEDI